VQVRGEIPAIDWAAGWMFNFPSNYSTATPHLVSLVGDGVAVTVKPGVHIEINATYYGQYITLIRMAVKKCIAVRVGVIHDFPDNQ
jgi:hypothetical protein